MRKVICGIYKITNPKGRIYIGQSNDIYKRWVNYSSESKSIKAQVKLYNSLKKYGIKCHKFEVICECEEGELNEKERYYQEIYSCIGKGGLNCILVETKTLRRVVCDDLRKKMSIAHKGKKLSQETKEKMSFAVKNQWINGVRKGKKGHRYTEEQKQKRRGINSPMYGKKASEETRKKQSLVRTGKKLPKEMVEKRAIAQTGLKRKQVTKDRISESLKGKTFSNNRKQGLSLASSYNKPVLNLETGIFYHNIRSAAHAYGFIPSTLERNIGGKTRRNKTSIIYI